ncbi:MAG: SBBP repeat-containing protein [Bacteroidetes bacterium]|nr:SBBP repeat-containing protein [Bacteroidota bacterium]MCA6442092.1 SBBP repeat-containing protein [Bacteroidota bacterium]
MKNPFKQRSISRITFITFILLINVVSSFAIKDNQKKEAGNANIPFWKQAYVPDYAAASLNTKPTKKEPDKEQAKEFMANAKQNVSFLENKGQMMDTEGKPVPFVLFKAEAPGMNVYITEKGLTYVFVKIEEEEEEREGEHEYKKKDGKDEHQDLMMPGKHDEKLKAEMAWINVNLKGATIKRENIIKEEQSAEHFNYFYGHCPDGIYDVYQYKKLTIKNVYPNIDWVFYNSQKGGMKYDFIVHPGANPSDIKLIYESEKPLDQDEKGNLQLKTKLGTLTENAPYSYIQENNAEVKSSFKTTKLNKHQVEVTFNINQNSFNRNSTLVIDPQLVWGTFYGGDNGINGAVSIDNDQMGNVFITGYSLSNTFPVQNPGGGAYFQGTLNGIANPFILKFSNNGVRLWVTYYGGSGNVLIPTYDFSNSICIDANGNVFVTGTTTSLNFPVQNPGGGGFYQANNNGGSFRQDVFILKFSNNGNRLWATYYGGSGDDFGQSICADSNGNVFVTGLTDSNDFPVQNSGTFFQGTLSGTKDAFVLKFDNNGVRLWATYYGGSGDDFGNAICADSNGNVFVTGYTESVDFPVQNAGTFFQGNNNGGQFSGRDVFILKFSNIGTRLWATYYGGSSADDEGYSICTDSIGNVFVTGLTYSSDFPVQNAGTFFQATFGGLADAFILKFDNNGNRLWATYFGGIDYDAFGTLDNITIDKCDNLYISFETYDTSFPHLINSSNSPYFDNSFNGGQNDIIIARFSNAGSLTWCTYLGGGGDDYREAIAVDGNNNLFITGEWSFIGNSNNYPLVNPGNGSYYDAIHNGGEDCYIVKLSPLQIQKQVSQVNATNCQCNGSATFSLTSVDAPYSYVWSNGQSLLNTVATSHTITNLCAGVYNVTVTAGCTQTVVETYTISGGGGLVAQANVLPGNTICAGQSLTLSTIAANTYTWSGPNNFTANTQNAVINNAQVTSSGVYTISVESGPGCAATATVAINVQAIEQPNVTFSYPTQYCIGNGNAQASLSNGFSTGGVFSSDAGLIIDANTGDIDLSASTAGTYIVTYNSAAGLCKAAGSNTAQVILNNSPVLELNPSSIKLSCGASATITVNGADDYSWSNTALLDCATCSVVVISPDKTTEYCVTGTRNNCTSKTCVNVTTEQTLDVPNAFTPNGDNNNDEFCLQGWAGCVQSFAISVFDRWGQEVFASNKANFCWDGTYQGKALNTAVFVYSIKASIDGKQIAKKGNITLLR